MNTTPTDLAPPRPSLAAMQAQLAAELSPRHRGLYTLLLLSALAVAIVSGSLLMTEEALPLRTRVALGGVFLVALVWTVVATRTLTHRRVLLARQRLMTSRLAVLFSSLFLLGAATVAATQPDLRSTALAAMFSGVVFVAAAVLLWYRAGRRYRDLQLRLRALSED